MIKFTDYYEEIEEIDPSSSREQNLKSLRAALRVWRKRHGDDSRIKESFINKAIEIFDNPRKHDEFHKWWEETQGHGGKVSPEQEFRALVYGTAMDGVITLHEYQLLLKEAKRKGISKKDAERIIKRIADERGATIEKVGSHHPPEMVHETFNSWRVKRPWLAALLSLLIIGLGQIYNGQIRKGLGFLIASVIFWVVGLSLVGASTVLAITLWIYSIYDAYKTANKINAGEMIA